MPWQCLHCETSNDYAHTHCEVCGYERYFSVAEVNELLSNASPALKDLAQLQAKLQHITSENKKLRQQNKVLREEAQQLQAQQSQHSPVLDQLQADKARLQQEQLLWKSGFAFSTFLLLVLLLSRCV